MVKKETMIVNDDLLDDGLINMPGLRVNGEIHVTRDGRKRSNGANAKPQQTEKPDFDKEEIDSEDEVYEEDLNAPIDDTNFIPANSKFVGNGWVPSDKCVSALDKIKKCVKSTAIFGGMSLLFFYWMQTGQMLESAAFPSIIVCSILAGLGIGKNIK